MFNLLKYWTITLQEDVSTPKKHPATYQKKTQTTKQKAGNTHKERTNAKKVCRHILTVQKVF